MPVSAPFRTLGAALLLATLAAGCDFTPTLDIETPAYERGLALRTILVADSVATVRLGESFDPYEGRPDNDRRQETTLGVVTLLRDGQPVEVLTLRPDRCDDYRSGPDPETGLPQTYPCGAYVGTVPIRAGRTYTVRAEADGWPLAEGTVTVPMRPVVEVVEEAVAAEEERRFRIRLQDPPGRGDRYGLALYRYLTEGRARICDDGGCRDTTYAIENPGFSSFQFDTNDPVILAAAAETSGSGITFASFTDETFDARTKTFTITPGARYDEETQNSGMRVQLAALSDDLYAAYRIDYFSGGEDNPFAEPVNLPTNVVGGYGLVGAVALAEATFAPRQP